LDGDKEAEESFMTLYQKLSELVKKEKVRAPNTPDIHFFESEDPEFIKLYEEISSELSCVEIVWINQLRDLRRAMRSDILNIIPIPYILQKHLSWETRDPVNREVNQILKHVLNEKFQEKMRARNPNFADINVLTRFARQYYDLRASEAPLQTFFGKHSPLVYWGKARAKEAVHAVKSTIQYLVKK
jgi:hypothetical protein